jgi:hypothetical protein
MPRADPVPLWGAGVAPTVSRTSHTTNQTISKSITGPIIHIPHPDHPYIIALLLGEIATEHIEYQPYEDKA